MARPDDSGSSKHRTVIIGKISGIYGVAGWVKLISYTRPLENIFSYTAWLVGHEGGWEQTRLVRGSRHGKGLIARLENLNDRDAARELIGMEIAVYREQMPTLPEGEYYWCDLIHLDVINQDDVNLGKVTGIQETGANDVLVVEGENRYLIPLVIGHHVQDIDMVNRCIRVDWDPEYI